MDELIISPTSSCSPPSPTSFFYGAPGHPVLEFVSCEVPEQWLVGDDDLDNDPSCQEGAAWAAGASRSAGSELSGKLPSMAERAAKRRGRKPGPRSDGSTISHVEAERQRREKLNRRFCDLRAAVPTVSRMDKASLLAAAAAYIGELRGRMERLEGEAKQTAAARKAPSAAAVASHALDLEVRMVGRDAAALRLTTAVRHAPARLMVAIHRTPASGRSNSCMRRPRVHAEGLAHERCSRPAFAFSQARCGLLHERSLASSMTQGTKQLNQG